MFAGNRYQSPGAVCDASGAQALPVGSNRYAHLCAQLSAHRTHVLVTDKPPNAIAHRWLRPQNHGISARTLLASQTRRDSSRPAVHSSPPTKHSGIPLRSSPPPHCQASRPLSPLRHLARPVLQTSSPSARHLESRLRHSQTVRPLTSNQRGRLQRRLPQSPAQAGKGGCLAFKLEGVRSPERLAA